MRYLRAKAKRSVKPRPFLTRFGIPFGEGLFEMPRPCLEAAGSDALWSGLANRARPWLSSPEFLVGLLAGPLPGLASLLNEI